MSIGIELRGREADTPRLPDLFAGTTRSADGAADPFLPPGYLTARKTYDVGSQARSAEGGDVWSTSIGFAAPLPLVPPGRYAATVTYTLIGR